MGKIVDKIYHRDKVVIITGGYQGIGLGITRAFADAGSRIVLVGRTESKGNEVCRQFREQGVEITYFRGDITDENDVESVVERTLEKYGTIDTLVNNAGVVHNIAAEDLTFDQWKSVLNVNLNGTFLMCRAVGRYMIKNGGGSIVNTSSISGVVAMSPQKQIDYHASKAGVDMITKCLAFEWAEHNIRVNAVAPGYIKTPLLEYGMKDMGWGDEWLYRTPAKRMGSPEEVGALVLFLASDMAPFMTGSVVVIDGGYTVL